MSVLSRYTNIISGEKYMTEQNALRHYISKAHKVQKRQNFEEMYFYSWNDLDGKRPTMEEYERQER